MSEADLRPPGRLVSCCGPSGLLPHAVRRQLRTLGRKIGHDVDFRMLRRSFATYFKKHGDVKSLQTMMRHSDPHTSMKHYVQEIPAATKAAADAFDAEIQALSKHPLKAAA